MKLLIFNIFFWFLILPSFSQGIESIEDLNTSAQFLIDEEEYSALENFLFGLEPELYPEVEAYLLEQIRKSILQGEEEKGLKIAEAILFVNLESLEAQNLYLSIQESIGEKERIAQLEKEEKERQERIAQGLPEDPGTPVSPQEQVQRAPLPSHSLDYLGFSLGAGINQLFANSGFANYSGMKTGFPVALEASYRHPGVTGGLDFHFIPSVLDFGEIDTLQWTYKPTFFLGLPRILPVNLRGGMLILQNPPSGEDEFTSLYQSLMSPTFGLEMRDYYVIKDLSLSGSLDLLLLAFGTEFLDFGLDLLFSGAYKLQLVEGFNTSLFAQVYSLFLFAESKNEINFNLTIGMRLKFNEN